MFSLVLKNKRSKHDHTKIYQTDLNSPCRELSNGGLIIVRTLLVYWEIDFFVCVSLIGNLAVSLIASVLMVPEGGKK